MFGKSSSEFGSRTSYTHLGTVVFLSPPKQILQQYLKLAYDIFGILTSSVPPSSYTAQPKLLTASLNTAYTIESHFKFSQFRIFLHCRFIFYGPSHNPIYTMYHVCRFNVSGCQVLMFLVVRFQCISNMKIQNLYQFRP